MTPLDAINWAKEKMLPYFSLGVFKTPEEDESATSSSSAKNG
jgi:hypothetical protein